MKLYTFKMFVSIFRFCLLLVVIMLCQSTTKAQSILSSANKTITQKQFFELIIKYHPVAKQSSLLTERGKKIIQQSKGAFDPQFYTYFDEKYFSSKNYYSLWDGGLKVSTRVGIDIKAGYQTSNGLYLNPEEITPANGLNYIGASVPLAQGLLIDSRRAALQQAKIFSKSLEAERIMMLNDLLFDAAKSYWQWVESYGQLIVFQKSLNVAQIRFDAVKSNLQNGESPSIDTVEALIQLQSLELNFQKSFLEFKNSGLIVSNYLWYENDQPMAMDSLLRPSIIDSLPSIQLEIPVSTIKKNLAEIIKNHPSVLEYTYKIKSAQVDKNFYTNKLLPKINFNYNLLNKGVGISQENLNNSYLNNNYKFGLELGMPLFLRTERANLGLAKIKIKEANYNLNLKELEIENKINAYINELSTLEKQLILFDKTISNYQRMLFAEEERFVQGESSIFLINNRQMKLVEAENKLVELKSKYYKTIAALSWACAQLN